MVVIVEHLELVRYGFSQQYRTGAAERLNIAVTAYGKQGIQDMEDRGFVAYPGYGGFYFDHLTLRRSTVPKTKKRYLSFSKRSIPPWIYCLFCFSSLFGTEPAYLVLIVVDAVDLHTTEDTEADAPAEEQANYEHGDLHFTFLLS